MKRNKTLRCISIREPWANLILEGKKTIELRNWFVSPETLYIHVPELQSIIGKMTIESIKHYKNFKELYEDEQKHLYYSDKKMYHWGWIIGKVTKLRRPYKDVKGKQFVWTWDKP